MTPEQRKHVHETLDALIEGRGAVDSSGNVLGPKDLTVWDLIVCDLLRAKPEVVRVYEWKSPTFTGGFRWLPEEEASFLGYQPNEKTGRYIESEVMTDE